jgi:hypothetical protein
MTDEQIKLLRLAIQREVEYASIDGFEHGAWGFAEKDADVSWKCFQESFGIPDELAHKTPTRPS